jgi:hypothetical protein
MAIFLGESGEASGAGVSRRPARSLGLAAAGAVIAAAVVSVLAWQSRSNVVTLGFWFDEEVSFELHDPARIGGPLTPAERARIEEIAREEIARAFAEFNVVVTERRDAFYRVVVRQWLTANRRYAASGQSNVFGPLGGSGAVSFLTLAAQAMAYAPAGATRADVIEGMGRGIGRAAVHEFAHQILPSGPMHTTEDAASYEYWSSDRPAQYYGDMHWSVARVRLEQRLGRR